MIKQRLLNHLEKVIAFKTIADCKALHQAAIKLRVSQPSLSASVKTLESQLGKQLLIRSHKGVSVTAHGQVLLDYAASILGEIDQFEKAWDRLNHEVTGELKVGIFDSIAVYFWPHFYRHFSRKYPGLTLNLVMGRSDELSKQLRSQDIDVSISVNSPNAKDVRNLLLYEDSFSFYMSKGLADELDLESSAGEAQLKRESIKKLELILFPDSASQSQKSKSRQSGAHNLEFARTIEVGSFEAARELCRSGLGVAMLPNRVAAYSSTKLLLCHFSQASEPRFLSHGIYASVLDRNSSQLAHARLLQELEIFSSQGITIR